MASAVKLDRLDKPLLLLVMLCVAFISGCAKEPNHEAKPKYRIGSLLALSGQHKSFGVNQQRGMEIALAEINAGGGINGVPLVIEYADTQLDEDKGLQEYKRLTLERDLQVIVGVTGSGVALKLSPLAARDNVLLLSSLDTSPRLTLEGGSHFFRNIASDAYSGVVLAEVAESRGQKNVALIYNAENAWANGCHQAVSAAVEGNSSLEFTTAPVSVLNSTDNFSSGILSFKSLGDELDAVFVCLMGRQAGLFVKQAADNGLEIGFYGTDSFSQQEFIDNAGSAAEHSLFVMPASSESEAYIAFTQKYHEMYGEQADTVAAKAYDAVKLLAAAVEKAGSTDPAKIISVLESIEVTGVTGENAFDDNGDLRYAKFDQFTYAGREMRPLPN